MPYKDKDKEKERYKRRFDSGYFRNHARNRPKKSLGYFGEIEALSILIGSIRLFKGGYDLLWDNKKVEVKTSLKRFHTSGRYGSEGWKFDIEGQKNKCDFFLLLCKNSEKVTEHILLVPVGHIKTETGIWLTPKNINHYSQFMIN